MITAERSKADAQQAQVEADSIRIEKEAKETRDRAIPGIGDLTGSSGAASVPSQGETNRKLGTSGVESSETCTCPKAARNEGNSGRLGILTQSCWVFDFSETVHVLELSTCSCSVLLGAKLWSFEFLVCLVAFARADFRASTTCDCIIIIVMSQKHLIQREPQIPRSSLLRVSMHCLSYFCCIDSIHAMKEAAA